MERSLQVDLSTIACTIPIIYSLQSASSHVMSCHFQWRVTFMFHTTLHWFDRFSLIDTVLWKYMIHPSRRICIKKWIICISSSSFLHPPKNIQRWWPSIPIEFQFQFPIQHGHDYSLYDHSQAKRLRIFVTMCHVLHQNKESVVAKPIN